METVNLLTSNCRLCQYYQPDGRRGGKCQLLSGVLVQGNWQACSLSLPAFTPAWEAEEVTILPASHNLFSQLQSQPQLNNEVSTNTLNTTGTVVKSQGNSIKIVIR